MVGVTGVLEGLVFPRRMSEDHRLLVALAFSLGFDTILAGLWLNVSFLSWEPCFSIDSQGAPLHI